MSSLMATTTLYSGPIPRGPVSRLAMFSPAPSRLLFSLLIWYCVQVKNRG